MFNNLISLSYPDDFKQLSDIENQKYFSGNHLRLSLQNQEKHILLSVSKSSDFFINRLISVTTVINGSLSNLESNLKEYHFIERYESTIFDKPAITVCFSYKANDKDIYQYGELSVFKNKKTFYNVYCISRLENKEENKKLFKEFRDSFSPINS